MSGVSLRNYLLGHFTKLTLYGHRKTAETIIQQSIGTLAVDRRAVTFQSINLLAQKHDRVTCATKQSEQDSKDTDAPAIEKYNYSEGGGLACCGPAQSPSRSTKCNSSYINDQCTNFILFDVTL